MHQQSQKPMRFSSLQSIEAEAEDYLSNLPKLAETPLVSIIIPTYNRPGLLKNALLSLMRQTYHNWEVIVVNDGGDPLSPGEKELPEDSRIRIINLTENRERSHCRNLALREARGSYVCFLDDDDVFYSRHLEVLIRSLENDSRERKVAYSASHRAWGTLQDEVFQIHKIEQVFGQTFDPDRLLVNNYIPILALLFHRDVLENASFDENLSLFEDHDLLIRLSRRHDFLDVPVVTHQIRVLKKPDADILERQIQQYRQLYDRYAPEARENWEVLWKQKEFLRSQENLLFRSQISDLPSVTILLDATTNADYLERTVRAIYQATDYPRFELVCFVQEKDYRALRSTGGLPHQLRIVSVPDGSDKAEPLMHTVQQSAGELLAFLETGCFPARPTWLFELIEMQLKYDAGIVSGMLIDARNGVTVKNTGIVLKKNTLLPGGLYERFPFYLPVIGQIREVDAAAPGAALLSKKSFLDAGGFDAQLSSGARWIDLCAKLKSEWEKPVVFDPFAAFLDYVADQRVNDVVSAAEMGILAGRWGKDLLRTESDWYVTDGFYNAVDGEQEEEPPGEMFERILKWSDRLQSEERFVEALALLQPALQVYPASEEISARLKQILALLPRPEPVLEP